MRTIKRSQRFMTSLGSAAGLLLFLLLSFMLDTSSTGAQEPTATVTEAPTIIITLTVIPSTPDPTVTNSPTAPGTVEPTPPTETGTPGPSPTLSATIPPTTTLTPGPTETSTPEPTATVTATATEIPTGTLTPGPSPTGTATISPTLTSVPTPTLTMTPTLTVTPVPTTTVTPAPTATITPTPAPTVTTTATPLPTSTPATTPTTVVEEPIVREPAAAGAVLPRTISVIGRGAIAVETEIVQVEIGVEAFRPLLQEAQGAAREQMEQVLAVLREHGVADADIQTASVDVRHEPARDPEGAVPGYRVIHTVHVTLRDLNRTAATLDAATGAGASHIAGLHFRLDNARAWETQALIQALDDAEARALQLAAYYGFELGEVIHIRQLAAQPGEDAASAPAAVHIPLGESVLAPPGRLQLSVQVEVVFTIRD